MRDVGSDERFEALRVAHDRLTAAYTEVHRKAERRRSARAAVDEHLRRGSKLLRDEYIQAAETIFTAPREEEWLYREIERLEDLGSTFDRRWIPSGAPNVAQNVIGFPGVKIILGATGLGAAWVAHSGSCLCHLISYIPIVVSFVLIAIVGPRFGSAVNLMSEEGIFEAEDAVYSQLGTEERPRLNYWRILLSAVALTWWAAVALETLGIHNHKFINSHAYRLWIAATIFTVLALITWLSTQRTQG